MAAFGQRNHWLFYCHIQFNLHQLQQLAVLISRLKQKLENCHV